MKNLSWMMVFFAAISMTAQAEEPTQNEGCPVELHCQKSEVDGIPYSVKLVETPSCPGSTVVVTIGDSDSVQCTKEGKVRVTFR